MTRSTLTVMAFLAILLLVPPSARAERPIVYGEALRGALEANPSLRVAAFEQQAATAGVTSALGFFDPQIGASGAWRRTNQKGFFQGFPFEARSSSWEVGTGLTGALPSGTSYSIDTRLDRNFSRYVTDFGVQQNESVQDAYTASASVSFTQQLLEGARLSWNLQNLRSARRSLGITELTLAQQRQQTLADVAQAYWAWVYAWEQRQIAEEAIRVAQEALRVGTARVEGGDLAPVERTRLEAALVQAQADALAAEDLLRFNRDTLLLLMGEQPGQDVLPATEPGEVAYVEVAAEPAIEVALAQNLDLAVARARVENSEALLRDARHGLLPSLATTLSTGIGAQADSAGGAIGGLTEDEAFPFVAVSGAFAVPLGNRVARGTVDQLEAELNIQRTRVAELERNVAAEVGQQVYEIQTALRRVELADANARLADETLAAEEALSEAGRTIQKDVLEARASAQRARVEAVKARTDYQLSLVELQRLQGQLEP